MPLFASGESLYFETGWERLVDRRKHRRLNLFYSIHNNTAPEYLIDLLPPLVSEVTQYNLRNNDDYVVQQHRLASTSKSFFFNTIRDWNLLNSDVRHSRSLGIFKERIKQPISKPPIYYNYGMRKINIIHTRLRNTCSSLNADLHRVNIINDPSCSCGHPVEDAIHFFLECENHTIHRRTLFAQINQYDISIELILAGDENLTVNQNVYIFSCIHSYIKNTNRFS